MERAKLRTLSLSLYGVDIFDLYIGSAVISALEIVVRGASVPVSECIKAVDEYISIDEVQEAYRKVRLTGLPLKYKIPAFLVKYKMSSLLVCLIHLASKLGLKLSAF